MLELRNLSDQLTDAVRDRILSGSISDSAPVRQDVLAAELGVSKIPLREALAKLEREGLLSAQAHRGYFVRALSAAEAEEVYALRLKLEPDLAALAARNADSGAQASARAAYASVDAATRAGTAGVGALNRLFHLALLRPADQPVTLGILERLHFLSERYVHKHLEYSGQEERAIREHAELLDRWLARDERGVADAMRTHVGVTLEHLRLKLSAAD